MLVDAFVIGDNVETGSCFDAKIDISSLFVFSLLFCQMDPGLPHYSTIVCGVFAFRVVMFYYS